MTSILPMDPLQFDLQRIDEPDYGERYLRQQLAQMHERHRMEAKPLIDMLVRIESMRIPKYLIRVQQ